MERTAVYFLGAAAAIVLVVGGTSAYLVTSPSPIPTGSLLNNGGAGSIDGLVLGASLNTSVLSPGQAVTLQIWETNPLATNVNVSAANDWFLPGLTLGPCGSMSFPFGFELLSGYYSASSPSLTSAQGIQLYAQGTYSCPAEYPVGSYLFHPTSSNATLGGFCTPEPCFSANMSTSEQITGQYVGNSATISPLPPGVYTVVVGDEWGASVFLYFTVSGTGPQGTVLLPEGTNVTVSSSFDCVAGHFQLAFSVQSTSSLTGAFAARSPGVTMYVATQQDASNINQGHPSSWVYSSGLQNSTSFAINLPQGSYVLWIEGADLNCGAQITNPLEMLTQVNITQGFTLAPV